MDRAGSERSMLCAPGVIKGVSIVRNKDSGFWARFLQTLGNSGSVVDLWNDRILARYGHEAHG